jgi:uncharacterized RDD family membrane protein YckC
MDWYYAANGQEIGPVDEAQLSELRQAKVINNNTLIWRAGMPNWASYQDTMNGARTGKARPVSTAEFTSAIPEAVCGECGGIFARAKTFEYGDVRICIACKPGFLQKRKAGKVDDTLNLGTASFGRRLGAFLIDITVLFGVDCIVSIIIALMIGLMGSRILFEMDHPLANNLIFGSVFLAVAILYDAIMVRFCGGTIGKLLTRIEVVTAEDKPISFFTAVFRSLVKYLSVSFCSAVFLIVFFVRRNQAAHDLLCNTRVVAKA